jgi:NAD+ kinase
LAAHPQPGRLALVVHPTRPIDGALAELRAWADAHGLPVLQPPVVGWSMRQVAPESGLERGDLIVALGGDGTVLTGLRASAPVEAPVLGVACGSLGALAAVGAEEIAGALDRVAEGEWAARSLPALAIRPDGGPDLWATNDFVVVRRRAAQVIAEIRVDDELYTRLSGDGLIVATPLGSAAYSMAAGGPLVVAGTPAFVCTPLAMHGGNAPPLVVPATSTLGITIRPSYSGFDVEIDGHAQDLEALEYRVGLHDHKLTLVTFGDARLGLAALRARGLIADSPRVLARDARNLRDLPAPPSPRSGR